MVDRYTKVMLTVIAAALSVLTVIEMTPTANAADGACGERSSDPCYVRVVARTYDDPLPVKVVD